MSAARVLLLLTGLVVIYQAWEVGNGLHSGRIGFGRYLQVDKNDAPKAYLGMLAYNIALSILLIMIFIQMVCETIA